MKASKPIQQCANAALMVAPHDFEFNEETSHDNEFQSRPSRDRAIINQQALVEFNNMVDTLRRHGVQVVIPEPRSTGPKTPDAVFPNNWFATEQDGTVLLFPMFPPGRRREKRVPAVENALVAAGFHFRNIINIGHFFETKHFLEGTGTMCIDHHRRLVYAARSERCHGEQLRNFAELRNYQTLLFDTSSSTGKPIYHTNVMMSVGDKFAVVGSETLPNADERTHLLSTLQAHHEVLEISREQVEKQMCGNILQMRGTDNAHLIVMSQRAYAGFTGAQREFLGRHGKLVPVQLDAIEEAGGGSARCMIAEVFLPKNVPWAD